MYKVPSIINKSKRTVLSITTTATIIVFPFLIAWYGLITSFWYTGIDVVDMQESIAVWHDNRYLECGIGFALWFTLIGVQKNRIFSIIMIAIIWITIIYWQLATKAIIPFLGIDALGLTSPTI